MTARTTMQLSKTCVALAGIVFAFDVLFALFLAVAASRTPDAASGHTMPLNYYRGFVLYLSPLEYGIFVGSLAVAGVLFLLGVFFYTRRKRAAGDEID